MPHRPHWRMQPFTCGLSCRAWGAISLPSLPTGRSGTVGSHGRLGYHDPGRKAIHARSASRAIHERAVAPPRHLALHAAQPILAKIGPAQTSSEENKFHRIGGKNSYSIREIDQPAACRPNLIPPCAIGEFSVAAIPGRAAWPVVEAAADRQTGSETIRIKRLSSSGDECQISVRRLGYQLGCLSGRQAGIKIP